MRGLSLLGLIVALLVVGWLASSRLQPTAKRPHDAPAAEPLAPARVKQQVQQAIDAAAQQPRPVPDE